MTTSLEQWQVPSFHISHFAFYNLLHPNDNIYTKIWYCWTCCHDNLLEFLFLTNHTTFWFLYWNLHGLLMLISLDTTSCIFSHYGQCYSLWWIIWLIEKCEIIISSDIFAKSELFVLFQLLICHRKSMSLGNMW